MSLALFKAALDRKDEPLVILSDALGERAAVRLHRRAEHRCEQILQLFQCPAIRIGPPLIRLWSAC